MGKRLAQLMITISLSFAGAGCTRTSPELPKNLHDLVVRIEVEQQSTATSSSDRIRAELANRDGTVIEQDETHIEVNGIRMQLRAGTGMYYNRFAYYYMDKQTHDNFKLLPSTDYHFVLVMPNGSRRPLTTLKTPFAVSMEQFSLFRIPSPTPAAAFTWSNLAGPMRLSIARGDQITDEAGQEVSVGGNPENEDALHRTIGPGWLRPRSGKWLLPQRFLISSPKRQLNRLEAWAQAETTAPVARPFSRKSSATAKRRLELGLEWPLPSKPGQQNLEPEESSGSLQR